MRQSTHSAAPCSWEGLTGGGAGWLDFHGSHDPPALEASAALSLPWDASDEPNMLPKPPKRPLFSVSPCSGAGSAYQ